MNTLDLITLHLHLECKKINARGDLVPVPCPNPDSVPRFYVAQHADTGEFSRFPRHDIAPELREALMALAPEEALHQHERVKRILEPFGASEEFYYGKSYICPDTFGQDDHPDVIQLEEAHRPLVEEYDPRLRVSRDAIFAVIVEGHIVSTCESARENGMAAEAWVRTLHDYRGRGLAKQVTAAWAANAWTNGKVPFYTHRMENQASEGVARGLGMRHFITDAGYS